MLNKIRWEFFQKYMGKASKQCREITGDIPLFSVPLNEIFADYDSIVRDAGMLKLKTKEIEC